MKKISIQHALSLTNEQLQQKVQYFAGQFLALRPRPNRHVPLYIFDLNEIQRAYRQLPHALRIEFAKNLMLICGDKGSPWAAILAASARQWCQAYIVTLTNKPEDEPITQADRKADIEGSCPAQ